MVRERHHRGMTAAAGLASLALAAGLAGCGGSSDADAGSSSSAPAGGSTAAAGAGGSSGVSVPADALLQPGTLTICSDISSPPLEFYTESNKPTGSDVDLGNAIAKKMGLTAAWANTSFNGIIPALQANRCDAIMSQLYIKPEREKVVDFVPYMYSGSTFLVKKANATSIKEASDLCGKKAAAETGTTVVEYLQEQSKKCESAGRPKIDIRQFEKDPAALQQLKIGLVDAYGTTVETAAYDSKQNAGQFATAGKPFNRIKVGIATRKDSGPLHDALGQALRQVHQDGHYDTIMKKWGLTADALPLG